MASNGITKKTLKNGTENIMVRFKYLGKTYPVKNFTKLFGCKTITTAREKLNEVKIELSKGNDPFNCHSQSLDYYMEETYKVNLIKKVWQENTAKNYLQYYNRNIRKSIGWKKLSKITYTDLDNIQKTLAHRKGTTLNTIKSLLNPIFKEAIRRGDIIHNPVELIKRVKVDKRERITTRTLETSLTMIKKLYHSVDKYTSQLVPTKELNAYLYLLLLTAHRFGELIKLTTNNIYLEKDLIISLSNITKTKEEYHFPIPIECKEYFKTIQSGLIFPNLKYSSVADYFRKLVSLSEIEFFKDKTLTPHDTRSLLLNVMIRDCKIDSRLADFCLDHSATGVIAHYLDFHYEDKKIAYNQYWDKIRDI